ncbi:hypothetical protein [Bythopirellula goksoeyrii]|uniref:Uncharacterized protein n=1 Tax=Bythopirellula goksoeyrii TaxID=1400387 RepID=A0A5B9QSW5_9BACT|nr:hypothetical protein [Bythopirellula goksoeyrii]QEG37191.1 hypothetical protein Pr1d_45320 [Bythopirellula goksoeyrii]
MSEPHPCFIRVNPWLIVFASREIDIMNKSLFTQLAVFVLVLIGLNFFFHLHISIIGSLLLTLGLSFVMRLLQSNT